MMQLQQMREVIKQSHELLSKTSVPDTFAGRKTQEPFPQEGEEIRIDGWLNSKELQPPK
jgi:hypothetical protein